MNMTYQVEYTERHTSGAEYERVVYCGTNRARAMRLARIMSDKHDCGACVVCMLPDTAEPTREVSVGHVVYVFGSLSERDGVTKAAA